MRRGHTCRYEAHHDGGGDPTRNRNHAPPSARRPRPTGGRVDSSGDRRVLLVLFGRGGGRGDRGPDARQDVQLLAALGTRGDVAFRFGGLAVEVGAQGLGVGMIIHRRFQC